MRFKVPELYHVTKIFGPPGTGKTFRLIRRVKAYQRKGVPLHKIGYFAFTKKAAQEARERIGVSEKKSSIFSNHTRVLLSLIRIKRGEYYTTLSLRRSW